MVLQAEILRLRLIRMTLRCSFTFDDEIEPYRAKEFQRQETAVD